MFIRFREHKTNKFCWKDDENRINLTRVSVSVVEVHRAGGKVRQTHIMGLGSILEPPTDLRRCDYWDRLRSVMAWPSNRILPAQWELLAASIANRIPPPDNATELGYMRERLTTLQLAAEISRQNGYAKGILDLVQINLRTQERIAELEAAVLRPGFETPG
jgi:hypothetical protein